MDTVTVPYLSVERLRRRRDSLLPFELTKFWQEVYTGSRASLGGT